MTDQIRVHTTHSVSYCDLPKPISDYIHTICCEWGIGTGERLGFDAVLEYYDEMDTQEGADKAHIINKFMKENDLEDSYLIDLDW